MLTKTSATNSVLSMADGQIVYQEYVSKDAHNSDEQEHNHEDQRSDHERQCAWFEEWCTQSNSAYMMAAKKEKRKGKERKTKQSM